MRQTIKRLLVLAVLVASLRGVGVANGSLVAHWKLDETTGTEVHDSSGNNHHGEILGGLSFDQGSAAGLIGNGLRLQGLEGQSICIDLVPVPTHSFTISLWFKPEMDMDSKSEGTYLMFWGQTDEDPDDKPCIEFNEEGNGQLHLHVKITGQEEYVLSSTSNSWEASRWHHIVATFDGLDFKLFVNGAVESTGHHPGVHYASKRVYFGNRYDGDHPFNGNFDDIRIYDVALSAEQIGELKMEEPALKELTEAIAQAQAMIDRSPGESIVFIKNKIAELKKWRQQNPDTYKLRCGELSCDLHFALARAGKAAGFAADEVKSAYELAFKQGMPSLSNYASILSFLSDEENVTRFKRMVRSLNEQNIDYLKPVATKSKEMILGGRSAAAVGFLEKNLAAYEQWQNENPFYDVVSQGRVVEVYYQLAKARQAVGASKKSIAEAYSKTFSSGRFNYLREQSDAFDWLIENNCSRQYQEPIRLLTESGQINEPLAGVVTKLCRDYESTKQWPKFKLLLDALFTQAKCPFELALFVESCLKNKTNRWAQKYFDYLESKPSLKFERDLALARKYTSEENYGKASELYHSLLKNSRSEDDKKSTVYELSKCMFLAGQYRKVILRLESYILSHKTDNRTQIKDAMLMKARAYVQLGEFDNAIEDCFTLMMEYPEAKQMAEVSFFFGYCNMLQGKFNQAQQAFQIVLKDYPGSDYSSKAQSCLNRIQQITQ